MEDLLMFPVALKLKIREIEPLPFHSGTVISSYLTAKLLWKLNR